MDLSYQLLQLKYKIKTFVKTKRRPRNWLLTLGIGLGIGLVTTFATVYFLWSRPNLAPFSVSLSDPHDPQGRPLWVTIFFLWTFHAIFGKSVLAGYSWQSVYNWLLKTDGVWKMNTIFYVSIFDGLFFGIVAGFVAGLGKKVETHVEGRQLHTDESVAFSATRKEISVSGKGICVHPAVPISKDRETRHIMILGSIGAGKTQVIRNIMKSVMERFKVGPTDRMIIYDNKSDVTEGLPVDDKEMILLAPWDQRTWAWDVAKDILNDVDATEIAKRLIPKSDDPFWSNAAQQLLVAVFIKLQRERGTDWSWKDINAELSDPYTLADAVKRYNPAMQTLMEDPTSKTAQSVITTLATFSLTIRLLTQAWDNVDPITNKTYEEGRVIPKISFREWALTPIVERRVIVMQGNKRYQTLEQAYVQSIISAFGAIMNSPEMTDDPNRRIWFFLDEFPQLGKLEGFAPYLEVGRSKGLCVILGLQDISQLREIYKQDAAASWAAICGTFIICRSQGVDTLEWLRKFFGERQIMRLSRSTSKSGESLSEQSTKEFIVKDHDILGLGPGKNGVDAILNLNNEKGVYKLTWPYQKFGKLRPSQIQAGWTRSVPFQRVDDIAAQLTSAFSHVFGEGFEEARRELAGETMEDANKAFPPEEDEDGDSESDMASLQVANSAHSTRSIASLPAAAENFEEETAKYLLKKGEKLSVSDSDLANAVDREEERVVHVTGVPGGTPKAYRLKEDAQATKPAPKLQFGPKESDEDEDPPQKPWFPMTEEDEEEEEEE